MSNVYPFAAKQIANALQEQDGVKRRVELDPRIERTADAMFEADKVVARLHSDFDSMFDNDGPEAA